MTQPIPDDAPRAGRDIAEILLARGFVTTEQLDEAKGRQHETGKPLGQILVEAGAISRLALASALAEQWSDIGSVSPEFGLGLPPPGGEGTLVEMQELRRARHELEERMLAFERTSDASPAELDERLDTLEAALSELQAADDGPFLTQLSQSVDSLGQRVGAAEPQLAELAESLHGVASRLALTDERVADVSARLAELGAAVEKAFVELERRSIEVADTVAALATDVESGPETGLAAATERIGEVEQRLDTVASSESLAELAARVDRLAGDADVRAERETAALETATRLDDLVHQVKALGARPTSDPGLAARIDELAARVDELAARPAADPELGGRLDELATRTGDLVSRVDALAARPVADGESDSRIAELGVRLERLATSVEALAARPTVDPLLAKRVDSLAVRLEEVASGTDQEARLTERVSELASRLEALGQALERAAPAADVEELRARVDAVAELPQPETGLGDLVESLAARVGELEGHPVRDEETGVRLDGLGDRLTRLEVLEAELRALAADAVSAEPSVTRDPEVDHRLAALDRTTAELGDGLARVQETLSQERSELDSRLESLASQFEDAVTAPAASALAAPSAGVDSDDVERLRMAVERVAMDFAEHRRAVAAALSSREFTALLEELAARVDELYSRGGTAPIESGGTATGGVGAVGSYRELHALEGRLEELEKASKSSHAGVLQRLERMMGTIDWRLQRLEHPGD